MKVVWMAIRHVFRVMMITAGGFAIGTVLHELYHYLTLSKVHEACLVFNEPGVVAYVTGVGDSSEVIAYIISWGTVLLAYTYAMWDMFTLIGIELDREEVADERIQVC